MLWATVLGVILILSVVTFSYFRSLKYQIMFVSMRLNSMKSRKKHNSVEIHKLLKRIISILNTCINTNNPQFAYQAADLLKLAFGEGFIRKNEAVRLMGVIIAAIRAKRQDIAGFTLDAFKPLTRQLAVDDQQQAVEQLSLIGVIALKHKQNFLAAKVIEILFCFMDRAGVNTDKQIISTVLKAFKVIGILALRRRDIAFFREIINRVTAWLRENNKSELSDEVVGIMNAWLHRIVILDRKDLFEMLSNSVLELVEDGVLTDKSIECLFSEWGNMAAIACLNPKSTMAAQILTIIFNITNHGYSKKHWTSCITIAGRVAKLAVSTHELKVAFAVIFPLFDAGKKLLWAELNLGKCSNELRSYALASLVRECLVVIALTARQQIVASSVDVINDIYELWITDPVIFNNRKYIKKYCQLLVLTWMKSKKRHLSKFISQDAELVKPILFSDSERTSLGI